jgi:hypothetical protein
MLTYSRRWAWLLVAMLILMGCASADRPDPATWRQSWMRMIALIPELEDLGSPPEQEICQEILADVRDGTSSLLPAPSTTVDDLVAEWVSVAETAFFECPPREHDFQSLDDVYAELDRIEESIETALGS